jgi:hypothetical protein
MTPFVVMARLAEPIVTYGDGLHLDGPLAFACYQDLTTEQKRTIPPIEEPWAIDFDLPIEKWNGPCELFANTDPRLTTDGVIGPDEDGVLVGNVWGWKCSAAIPVGEVWNTTHDHRRRPAFDEMVLWSNAKRAEMGGGPRAARNLKFPAIVTNRLIWFGVGDLDRAIYLLQRHVPAIGKLARSGSGRVLEWSIEKTDRDRSMIGEHGQTMRRLPARMFPDKPFSEGSIRAPYHHRSRWVNTVAPEV